MYKYTDDKAPIADSGLNPDERLMAKTSFAALSAPCAYDVDADAVRAFYDPLGDGASLSLRNGGMGGCLCLETH